MNNNEFYKIHLLDDNEWHNIIKEEYSAYKKEYKPYAAAVTYLMYSGISHASGESNYFTEEMADSYANAFQVHQKPCRTAYVHKYWIRKLPYIWYLGLIAMPVDIYVHTYQLIFGEHDVFLEGGGFFIPYQVSHWIMLSIALFAHYVYNYISSNYWKYYFKFIKMNLILHEYIYRFTIRKLSLTYRVMEFLLFIVMVMNVNNAIQKQFSNTIPDSEKQLMIIM
jgi:hypothetical protein|uniref:Uncharacterized protein n=1 Tax=viral metagenome TaxID=1070528 RepID=A0A6C0J6D5_9ZZZZ